MLPLDAEAWLTREGGAAARVPHASTSTSLERPASAALTRTRTLVVVTAGKVSLRHTELLFVTLPPGTVNHCAPSQYCN